MNKILELKQKPFTQSKRKSSGFSLSFNKSQIINLKRINNLIKSLEIVVFYYTQKQELFKGALVTVYYNKIVAKSNRIKGLLKGQNSNFCIVGNKFNEEKNKHITTYFLELNDIENSIKDLKIIYEVIEKHFNGKIENDAFEKIEEFNTIISKYISISKFKNIISDISYIEDFGIFETKPENNKNNIISFYNTDSDTNDIKKILKSLNIKIYANNLLDDNTIVVDENQARIIFKEIPYLVSMSFEDQGTFFVDQKKGKSKEILKTIKKPKNEPVIGVLDTLFDKNVYFNEWVESYDKINKNIPREAKDYEHGTKVCSIIVDGPSLNPKLDDGCGNFRVKHFGIATASKFSSATILKNIRDVVLENPDIKVWNLSLGSSIEKPENNISLIASVLDELQSQKDIIFVVAGTNKNAEDESVKKIGSPADSINSVVVNSVRMDKKPASYTRRGIVLSFFAKPDVSYYGGDEQEPLNACSHSGLSEVKGTSFAAPWIARKLAYLIHVIGLTREAAKALLIDSARDWNANPTPQEIEEIGHGIVPIKIKDILQTPNNQIKFIINDVSSEKDAFCYAFPVPINKEAHNYSYRAKATMTYFPSCNKLQGVDYTNTELNISFGRINNNNKIVTINNNKQNITDNQPNYLYEQEARKLFRKWDNVKYISESIKKSPKTKIAYSKENWGMNISKTNRLSNENNRDIKFSVVVTLENFKGENRIDEFIKKCNYNGWLVNEIDVENKLNFYEKLDEKLNLE